MKDADYIRRVTRDLAHWSSQGWISPEAQVHIADDVRARYPLKDRRDAAGWIGLGGASLAGLAFIAFIAANWGAMAPGWRLVLILGVLLALTLATAAVAAREGITATPRTRNGLALVTVLAFAAGIGLIGQSFNMPGGAGGLYLLATLGGLAMSFAARSSAAGLAALGFGLFWYGQTSPLWDFEAGFSGNDLLTLVLMVGLAGLCRLLSSRVLLHGLLLAAGWLSAIWMSKLFVLLGGSQAWSEQVFAALALVWLAIGGAARYRLPHPGMLTLYGYCAWFAGFSLLVCALDGKGEGFGWQALLIVVGLGLGGLGAYDRFGWVAAAGVLSAATGVALFLLNLGLPLMTASLVFAGLAALAFAFAHGLSRRDSGKTEGKEPVQ